MTRRVLMHQEVLAQELSSSKYLSFIKDFFLFHFSLSNEA